jgi:hypothetical protein
VELALPAKGHKHDESWGRQSERTSELPTSDLVRILVQRVQDEREGAEAPPAYPATPRFPEGVGSEYENGGTVRDKMGARGHGESQV